MYEIKVSGMTCNHCVGTVSKTIRSFDPESKPVVDLNSQTARFETKKDISSLSKMLEEEGYPVVSINQE
ncbi:heavy-metal-associated domain-containing protein [Leptospira licerasiae]|uniref:Heavy metal-associated domain protein n=1 Tax=Leptospira licerasiae str. MMD4847 TaxID=1049971 RepID=A0ABP2R8N1_9LEPT|nr:heavy-metal-associated domain-containing protein [Leptospira licerasiae]EIE02743.1 heavy metal-associated domain protein [Leptospira licerasiae serovar Varillal str. VAR 010]EJZ40588.1 heavy metal-associated domain protein [Leptospira licerasiae str. MMD4847]